MNFSLNDLLVLIAYLFVVLYAGLKSAKSDSSGGFFLADRKIPWKIIMLSIVATETSSLTFLNIPGISFKSDISFLQVAFGYILGRTFVAYVLLPAYYKYGYSSVYEWIGLKFGSTTQKSVSSVFLITRVLGDGVRLYATSIPLAILFHYYLKEYMGEEGAGISALIVISVSTSLYTIFGGFKSVVITDALQFFVYVFGGIFSFFFLLNDVSLQSGLADSFSKIVSSNKLLFYHGFEGDFFHKPYFFINGIIGGALLSIGSHGVDQMFAQRLLACKTEREGRLALIGSGLIVFFQFALFLAIGLLLFIKYTGETIHQDKVFSKYIMENLPTPVLGLILAAVLASAMSTLSSSINSMSLTVVYDWMLKDASEESKVKKSKILSLFWGIILFVSSLLPYYLSAGLSEGLVEIGLKIASYTFGPLIALFILARTNTDYEYSPSSLVFALFSSLITSISQSLYLKPAMAYLIPIGFISFYIFLVPGILSRKKGVV